MSRKFRARPHEAKPRSAPRRPEPQGQPPATAQPVMRRKGPTADEQATERWADEGGSTRPGPSGEMEHGSAKGDGA